jgi:type II secretory pathway component PulF
MPRFRYHAVGQDRETVSGHLDADSREEAIAQLESVGLQEVTIEGEVEISNGGESLDPAVSASVDSPPGEAEQRLPTRPAALNLTDADVGDYGETLANLASAGLPLESGLRALAEEIPSARTARALAGISHRLEQGEPLGQVVGGDSAANLPASLREFLQSGLGGPSLARCMSQYVRIARHAARMRRSIWFGFLYSLILLFTVAAMSVAFMVLLMPEFKSIFAGFDTELPQMTLMLVDFSDFLIEYGLYLLLGLVLAIVGIRWWRGTHSGQRFFSRVVYGLPVVGEACRRVSLATFCRLFSILLATRLPLDLVLRLAAAATRDVQFEASCERVAERVRVGISLYDAARAELIFPQHLVELFRREEHPSDFADVIVGRADMFENDVVIRVGLIPLVVEPVVLCGIASAAFISIGAVYLPLIKLLNALS